MDGWADAVLFSLGCALLGAMLLGLLSFVILMTVYWAPRAFGGC